MAERRDRSHGFSLAALALAGVLVYWLRYILLPFVVAGALAFVATPGIDWLVRHLRVRRRAAALLVFALYLALVGAAALWARHVLAPEVVRFAEKLPYMIGHTLDEVFSGRSLSFMGKEFDAPSARAEVMAAINASLGAGPQLFSVAAVAVEAGMGIVLALVLLFYFLVSGPEIVEGSINLAPPRLRPRLREGVRQVRPVLFRYVSGVLVIVAYTALAAWVGIRFILSSPHAVLIAIAVGVLELIPVIGPIASGVLMGAIALGEGSHLSVAFGFVAYAIALRLSIDQVVGPVVLGRAVTLHPVVIIFSFLAGGVLFGALGVLVAVPAAAIIKIILEAAYAGAAGRSDGGAEGGAA